MANSNHAASCNNELNTMGEKKKKWELARVSTATASVHHYHSIMEKSKCPEIHGKHINSIIKPHTTQIRYPFSIAHPKQTKSMENIFVHENENSNFSQHSSPIHVIQVAMNSAKHGLSKAWHNLEKRENRALTWFWRKVRCSGYLSDTGTNRCPQCLEMLNAWRKPAQWCL